MSSGELDKKQYANTCRMCGQVFDLAITFCPHDGTRLARELVGATSHDLIKITGPSPVIKSGTPKETGSQAKPNGGKENAQSAAERSPTAGQPWVSRGGDETGGEEKDDQAKEAREKGDLEKTDPNLTLQLTDGLDGRTVVSTGNLTGSRTAGPPPPDAHMKESLAGTTLDGKYLIGEVIGRGGMSIVYKGKHLVLNNVVAVKTLLPHLVLHPMSLQRFHQEAKAASNLRHPNVITVYDFGSTPEGQPYLVMDYVEGESLGDLLEAQHHLKPERALGIFIQVADALAHAHAKGIIHRDLKPTNILLLEKDGQRDFVKIVDFGIAKLLPQEGSEAVSLTQTGEVFGSPLYMSPEQCKGEKLDARADIYSMGCLMYETLSGRTPIEGENTMEVLFKHIHEVPPSISDSRVRVPEPLERMVFKCLAKDPAQRYQSMEQLKEELENYISSERTHILGQLSSRWELFWLKRRPRTMREKLTVLSAVLGVGTALSLCAYLGITYWTAVNSRAAHTVLVWSEDRNPPAQPPASTPAAETNTTWHCQTLTSVIKDGQTPEEIMKYINEGLESIEAQKDYRQAVKLLRIAARWAREVNGTTKTFPTQRMQVRYAECAQKAQYYEEAAAAYRTALEVVDTWNHPDRSHIRASLGDIYYRQGKWKDAAREYSNALTELNLWFAYQARRERGILSQDTPVMILHMFTLPMNDKEAHESPEIAMIVSHLATCYQYLLDEAIADKRGEMVERYKNAAPKAFLDAYERWKLIRGNANDNEAVALANYLSTEHLADKEQKLDRLYSELLAQAPTLYGPESTYYGVILNNHASYLFDHGDFINGLKERLQAINIFSHVK